MASLQFTDPKWLLLAPAIIAVYVSALWLLRPSVGGSILAALLATVSSVVVDRAAELSLVVRKVLLSFVIYSDGSVTSTTEPNAVISAVYYPGVVIACVAVLCVFIHLVYWGFCRSNDAVEEFRRQVMHEASKRLFCPAEKTE